jgi:hypothetical protein
MVLWRTFDACTLDCAHIWRMLHLDDEHWVIDDLACLLDTLPTPLGPWTLHFELETLHIQLDVSLRGQEAHTLGHCTL